MLRKWVAVSIALVTGMATTSVLAQEAQPAPPANPQLGGSSTISYYRIGAGEFQPGNSAVVWTRGAGDLIYSLDAMSTNLFFATPHLPGGAVLKSIEFDNCDTNTDGKHLLFFLYGCDYHGTCSVPLAILTSAANELGADCSFVSKDLSSSAYTVNNNLTALSVQAQLAAGDETNQLAGAIIGYQLQVSPDPPTSTFSDVPVGHPFHQFVEALAKAGITAGYPDGRFGVDDSITRGQMAVFLAKALGLNWSQ